MIQDPGELPAAPMPGRATVSLCLWLRIWKAPQDSSAQAGLRTSGVTLHFPGCAGRMVRVTLGMCGWVFMSPGPGLRSSLSDERASLLLAALPLPDSGP